jgi:hypothetical protein
LRAAPAREKATSSRQIAPLHSTKHTHRVNIRPLMRGYSSQYPSPTGQQVQWRLFYIHRHLLLYRFRLLFFRQFARCRCRLESLCRCWQRRLGKRGRRRRRRTWRETGRRRRRRRTRTRTGGVGGGGGGGGGCVSRRGQRSVGQDQRRVRRRPRPHHLCGRLRLGRVGEFRGGEVRRGQLPAEQR